MSRYRKKPLAQFEHGTRIYAPTANEPRFRVVATDPTNDERIFVKCPSEGHARAKARELEQFLAQAAPIRDLRVDGARTVERLAASYVEDHLAELSLRYREKQQHLLRRWILPHIGDRTVTAWTPADSAGVLSAARHAGASEATVHDIGGAMRGLVTHARRLRWLTSQSEDPLWMVRYAQQSTVQETPAVYGTWPARRCPPTTTAARCLPHSTTTANTDGPSR